MAPTSPPARILIVEDEWIIAAALQLRVSRMGHTVVATASSGREALEKAATLRPDVVLMDVKLRGAMDGVEAGTSVQSRLGIPVVYLTAYSEADILARLQGSRPGGVLRKPFTIDTLQPVLEEILFRQRAAGPPPSSSATGPTTCT